MSGQWSVPEGRGPLSFAPADRTDVAEGGPVAFLDRDGTLNEGIAEVDSQLLESPLSVEDVRLIPGAAMAAEALTEAGYALVCVTNQPAAAKGKVSIGELLAVHQRVVELLAREGVRLAVSLLCPHHPAGVIDELSGPCDCRKPAPGMLLHAAGAQGAELGASWMLGDTDADVRAGRLAGCRTVLIEYPGSAHKRSAEASPDLRAADLLDAVAKVLDHKRG